MENIGTLITSEQKQNFNRDRRDIHPSKYSIVSLRVPFIKTDDDMSCIIELFVEKKNSIESSEMK